MYTDCLNVQKHWALPLGALLAGHRPYSGVLVQALAMRPRLRDVVKVSAHQSMDLDLDEAESFKRLGNHFADLGAKEAVKMHPTLPPVSAKSLTTAFLSPALSASWPQNASMVQA